MWADVLSNAAGIVRLAAFFVAPVVVSIAVGVRVYRAFTRG